MPLPDLKQLSRKTLIEYHHMATISGREADAQAIRNELTERDNRVAAGLKAAHAR